MREPISISFAAALATAPAEAPPAPVPQPAEQPAPAAPRTRFTQAGTRAPVPVAEVVVLTRNSREALARSLPAIAEGAALAGAPLLFIDFGSTDGTQAYISGHVRHARAVWLDAADQLIDALTVATACSRAEVLVVLDPTLEPVTPDALARLVEHLRQYPYAGIAAPALRAGTGDLVRSTRPAPLPREHSRVEWVLSDAFAIRRADLDAVMRDARRRARSPEGLGVCLELRRRGLEVHYVPSIELHDSGGGVGQRTGARPRQAWLRAWRLLLRHPRYALRLAGHKPVARRAARLLTRSLELAVTILLLAAVAPLMLAIAIAIRLDSSGPALFRQVRLGRRRRPFQMYKFRTMRADADSAPHAHFVRDMILGTLPGGNHNGAGDSKRIFKVHPDPRVTRVGRLLRRTSLDELPQLLNVLRGDMTLVGFRPPIPYELDNYPAWYHRRFDGKPGITGLWQVSGRNQRSYEEMVRLDIEYLNRRSWLFDVMLLVRTVGAVLGGRGAY